MSDNLVTDQDLPKDTVEDMEVDKDATEQTTDDSNELALFRTPESEKNKIPAIENCPPPPEKSRKTRFGKDESPAPEMEFFEKNGREDVEMFFDSCTENPEMPADGRLSLKKRLFVDSSSVNHKKD